MDLFSLQAVFATELAALGGQAAKAVEAAWRVAALFGLVVIGILASWFWVVGWAYVSHPDKGWQGGPWAVFGVRIVLSLIVAALTFVPTYNKISQGTAQSFVPYLVAFQNGFFWQSAYDAVAKQFTSPPTP